MKIGFYDSGLGGVKMLSDCIDNGICGDFYLIADNKNSPYGIKTKEEVLLCARKCISYLVKLGCNIIVVACNTVTSAVLDILRNEYKDVIFIGTEPNIEDAVNDISHKKIVVLATSLTIDGDLLNNKIDKLYNRDDFILIKADKLVRLIQNSNYNSSKEEVDSYLRELFSSIDINQVSHIVLGCTHFPCARENIIDILGNNIHVVDSASKTTSELNKYLVNKSNNHINVFITMEDKNFEYTVSQILNNKDYEIKTID